MKQIKRRKMKVILTILLVAAICGAALLGAATRNSPATNVHFLRSVIHSRKLDEFLVGQFIEKFVERFTMTKCQPICVGWYNAVSSPANCATYCAEERGQGMGNCIQDCQEFVSIVTDSVGSPGTWCQKTLCALLQDLVDGEFEIPENILQLTPALSLRAGPVNFVLED